MNRNTQQQQINRLTKAKAYAWAMYYNEIERTHTAALNHYYTVNRVVEDEFIPFPEHLTAEYNQMLKDLHKQIECPICMEIIGDDLKITGCGHKYCNSCFEKIDRCAICRRKIKKN
jgi:hypothetical protein